MNKKHKPPVLCYVRRWIVGASPSAVWGRCTLGLHHRCAACSGCTCNVHEIMEEGFLRGMKEGMTVESIPEQIKKIIK